MNFCQKKTSPGGIRTQDLELQSKLHDELDRSAIDLFWDVDDWAFTVGIYTANIWIANLS